MISLPPLSAEYQYEEDLDSEWEDFNRLMTEYRLRHGRMHPQSSSFLGLDYAPARKAHEQTSFYPCPPSAVEDEKDDPLNYIGSAVRIILNFKLKTTAKNIQICQWTFKFSPNESKSFYNRFDQKKEKKNESKNKN